MRAEEYWQQVARSMSEKDLQAQVVELAQRLGWLYYHTHRSDRSPAGFPDLVLVRGDRILYRELKTSKGRLSAAQQEWLAALVSAGADASVWRPGDWVARRIEKELGL